MISKFRPVSEFETHERCFIVEIHNRSDDPGCSIARARVSPGVTTQLHAVRGIDERYVILAGEGRVEVGGEAPTAVSALDVVHIAPGRSQRITNTGREDLIFLAICTPRFNPDCYERLEQ